MVQAVFILIIGCDTIEEDCMISLKRYRSNLLKVVYFCVCVCYSFCIGHASIRKRYWSTGACCPPKKSVMNQSLNATPEFTLRSKRIPGTRSGTPIIAQFCQVLNVLIHFSQTSRLIIGAMFFLPSGGFQCEHHQDIIVTNVSFM